MQALVCRPANLLKPHELVWPVCPRGMDGLTILGVIRSLPLLVPQVGRTSPPVTHRQTSFDTTTIVSVSASDASVRTQPHFRHELCTILLTNSASIVLVNGTVDHGERQVDESPAELRFFSERLPGADVELFDLFHEPVHSHHDYLRELAKGAIQRLQRWSGKRSAVMTPFRLLSSQWSQC